MDEGSRISQVEPDDSKASFQRESGTSESKQKMGSWTQMLGWCEERPTNAEKQSYQPSRALRRTQLHQRPDISSQGLVWIPFLSKCKKINLRGRESLNPLLQQSHETGTTPCGFGSACSPKPSLPTSLAIRPPLYPTKGKVCREGRGPASVVALPLCEAATVLLCRASEGTWVWEETRREAHRASGVIVVIREY